MRAQLLLYRPAHKHAIFMHSCNALSYPKDLVPWGASCAHLCLFLWNRQITESVPLSELHRAHTPC